jgi:hypothetical protein
MDHGKHMPMKDAPKSRKGSKRAKRLAKKIYK